MRVELTREMDSAEWDGLVGRDRASTFFHTTAWLRAMTVAPGRREPLYLTGRSEGRLVAGLPCAVRSVACLRILESMPFGTFGGPVVSSEAPKDAASLLGQAFSELARRPAVGAAHVVDYAGRTGSGLEGFRSVGRTVQVVDLDKSYAEVEAGFRPSARNKIRKARRAGVTVRRGESESDFLAYHDMLLECARRWGSPPGIGEAFLLELRRLAGDSVQVLLAEHEGAVIGGDLNFAYGDTVFNWGNVSRDAARTLAPNNLLHATAMQEGIRDGRKVYNLGSSAGIEGVEHFKASFGAEPIPYRLFTLEKAWFRALRRATGRRE